MRSDAADIVTFWLGPDRSPAAFATQQKTWYANDAALDADIASRFGANLDAAEAGELDSWIETEEGALALVILFDQFTRNLNRGTPDAYRNDPAGQRVIRTLIEANRLEQYDPAAQLLLYHPLHHSEDAQDQQQVISLYEGLLASSGETWHDIVKGNLDFARGHAEIVARFGRFPHRNRLLGRENTPEEDAYLEKDARTYGQ